MKGPTPPFLEIAFYKKNVQRRVFFREVFHALIAHGARFTGEYVYTAESIEHGSGPFDFNVVERGVTDIETFEKMLNEDNISVVQADLGGIIEDDPETCERLTYMSIDETIVESEVLPVGLWLSGGDFFSQREYASASLTGKVKRRFVEVTEKIKPDYAVITDESSPIVTPAEISNEVPNSCFQVCFLNNRLSRELYGLCKWIDKVDTINTSSGSFFFLMPQLCEPGKMLSDKMVAEFCAAVDSVLSDETSW